jgi:hypothetical protein
MDPTLAMKMSQILMNQRGMVESTVTENRLAQLEERLVDLATKATPMWCNSRKLAGSIYEKQRARLTVSELSLAYCYGGLKSGPVTCSAWRAVCVTGPNLLGGVCETGTRNG